MPFPSPMHACILSRFSHVQLYVTPWTAAHQAPLSTEFSRQFSKNSPLEWRLHCHFLLQASPLAGENLLAAQLPWSFSLGAFKISVPGILQFPYNLSRYGFLYSYSTWRSFCFLNLKMHIFHQFSKFSDVVSEYFPSATVSHLFSFFKVFPFHIKKLFFVYLSVLSSALDNFLRPFFQLAKSLLSYIQPAVWLIYGEFLFFFPPRNVLFL